MAAQTDDKVIDVNVVRIKPKYVMNEMACLASRVALIQKHGGQSLGIFLGEGGNFGELIHLVQWNSLNQRSKVWQSLISDPEFINLHKTTAKYVYGGESYICKQSLTFPMKPLNPNGMLLMRQYGVIGFGPHASNKFKETKEFMDKKGPASNILGVLHPLFYPEKCFFAFFEVPNNDADLMAKNYIKNLFDPSNWPKLEEAHERITDLTSRLLQPIDLKNLPKADDCKLQ